MIVFGYDPSLGDCKHVCAGAPLDERVQYEAFTGRPYDSEAVAWELYELPGPKWVMFDDKEPLAVACFTPKRKGVGFTSFVATERAWADFGQEVTEFARDILRAGLDSGIAHRVEVFCLASRERAQRWYVRIGLALESRQKGYGVNGEDAVLYVALKGSK